MKKVLMAFLSMFLIASIAFGTGKKERGDVFGEKTKISSVALDAPSSPWYPMQQSLQSQLVSMRTVEYSPTNNNVIWMSGAAGSPKSGSSVPYYRWRRQLGAVHASKAGARAVRPISHKERYG